MITNEDIVKRFLEVLDYLIDQGRIAHIAHFAQLVQAHKSAFTKLRADPSRNLLKVHWIAYLYQHYGVSPEYILVGEGDYFAAD